MKIEFKGSAPRKPSSVAARTSTKTSPGWVAGNWSGYAIKGKRNAFRGISARWIVPRVKPSRTGRYSSAWIGIDGFSNASLIQTGTEQDSRNGRTSYYPWWEILPAPETRIRRPVSPGDEMYARISKLRNRRWLIVLRNRTKGWTFRTVRTYAGPAATAEWIMEAPSINGKTTTLARYGKILFRDCTINGRNPSLTSTDRGIMRQGVRVVSVPSFPNKTKDGFFIAYGSAMPSPPKR